MPQAKLSTKTLGALTSLPADRTEMEDLLFRTKLELVSTTEEQTTVEVTHDRLDLMSESGVAGLIHGLRTGKRLMDYDCQFDPLPGMEIRVSQSVKEMRGAIAAAVVKAPGGTTMDEGLLGELIAFQELLHATLGSDRRRASIGLYPLRLLKPPFVFSTENPKEVRFTPLKTEGFQKGEVDGEIFLKSHPMARKYGHLGASPTRMLTLRDSAGNLLSAPPILNSSGHGEISSQDSEVLIESTGTSMQTARHMVGYMLLPFAMRRWMVSPVSTHEAGSRDEGVTVVRSRDVAISPSYASSLLGRDIPGPEAMAALTSSGFKVREGRDQLTVEVPPWRPDILGEVDLVEDVAIAIGLKAFEPISGKDLTHGHRSAVSRFNSRFLEVMIGMGYQEMHTPVLLPTALSRKLGDMGSEISLVNPISDEFAVVRPSLLPGLAIALSANTGERYPQHLFEISDVVRKDSQSESGTATYTHLGAVDAGEGAGLSRSLSLGERVLRAAGMVSVREATSAPGSISGRVAAFKFAGEVVAKAGELHPELLSDLKIQEPVGWLEVDLSMLWKLRDGKL